MLTLHIIIIPTEAGGILFISFIITSLRIVDYLNVGLVGGLSLQFID